MALDDNCGRTGFRGLTAAGTRAALATTLVVLVLVLLPGVQACTYAPEPDGRILAPAGASAWWTNRGNVVGRLGANGDWVAAGPGVWAGTSLAGDPTGRWLAFPADVSDYNAHCSAMLPGPPTGWLAVNDLETGVQRRLNASLVASNGSWLVTLDGNGTIGERRLDNVDRVVARAVPVRTALALSADGLLLASTDSGFLAVYHMSSGTTNGTRIPIPEQLTAASFSPDGLFLAAVSYREGRASLWVADLSGHGTLHHVALTDERPLSMSWGPGGLAVLEEVDRGGRIELWDTALANATRRTVTSFGGGLAWSPDGHLAYWSDGRVQELATPALTPLGSGHSAPSAAALWILPLLAVASMVHRKRWPR